MIIGHLALVTAALFTGAAIYVNVAEQPARLSLADGSMLGQWQASYRRAAPMQAGLALAGGVLGFIAYVASGGWPFALGAVVLLSAWPVTLILIKPTNDALHAIQLPAADATARQLVEHWGRLHAIRSGIGIAATLLFLLAVS
jgi:hypothetical protein